MSIEEQVHQICHSLLEAMKDGEKFDSGNAAAGTRVRKAAMQAIKDLKAVRIAVQEKKNAG